MLVFPPVVVVEPPVPSNPSRRASVSSDDPALVVFSVEFIEVSQVLSPSKLSRKLSSPHHPVLDVEPLEFTMSPSCPTMEVI